jgi:hypothetical protein
MVFCLNNVEKIAPNCFSKCKSLCEILFGSDFVLKEIGCCFFCLSEGKSIELEIALEG